MTTVRTSTATNRPGQAVTYSAPGCQTCAGRRAQRLDSYGGGQPRAEDNAEKAAARLGAGAHLHFSVTDDCYAVVRAVGTDEEVTP